MTARPYVWRTTGYLSGQPDPAQLLGEVNKAVARIEAGDRSRGAATAYFAAAARLRFAEAGGSGIYSVWEDSTGFGYRHKGVSVWVGDTLPFFRPALAAAYEANAAREAIADAAPASASASGAAPGRPPVLLLVAAAAAAALLLGRR